MILKRTASLPSEFTVDARPVASAGSTAPPPRSAPPFVDPVAEAARTGKVACGSRPPAVVKLPPVPDEHLQSCRCRRLCPVERAS